MKSKSCDKNRNPRTNDMSIVTEVGGLGDEVIECLVEIEDGDFEIRELPGQRRRRRVELPVEFQRDRVEVTDAPIASPAVQSNGRRQAAQRRQVGDPNPASS